MKKITEKKELVAIEIQTHDLWRVSWTLCYLGHPSQKQNRQKSLVYIYNGKTPPSLSRLAGIGNLGKIFVEARHILNFILNQKIPVLGFSSGTRRSGLS